MDLFQNLNINDLSQIYKWVKFSDQIASKALKEHCRSYPQSCPQKFKNYGFSVYVQLMPGNEIVKLLGAQKYNKKGEILIKSGVGAQRKLYKKI